MCKNKLIYEGTDMTATFDIDPSMTVYEVMEEVVAPMLLSMGYSPKLVVNIISKTVEEKLDVRHVIE